jgi:S-formylglutathione hydrolase FrmB
MNRIHRRLATGLFVLLMTAATAVFVGGYSRADVAPAASGATVVAENWLTSREVDVTVHSPANNRNILVRLLVPNGWSADTTQTWPVLYLLHGGNDDYTSWTRETDIAALSANAGVIVVMPDAGRDAIYTDWFSVDAAHPDSGKWETFHLVELWDLLRASFHASPVRAVAGLSSGGYGAMIYAARHPGMFTFAAAFSGPMNLFGAIQPVFLEGFAANGDDPNAVWGPIDTQRANWVAHDPVSQAANLKGTGLYLSSGLTGLPGDLDPNTSIANAQFGEALVGIDAMTMRSTLRNDNIPVTTHLYLNGTHSWPYWQRELHASWPLIMQSIGVSV